MPPHQSQEQLESVVNSVLCAGELLIAEWNRPEGPRGSGDKAEIDEEIETLLRQQLLAILDCDFWGEETGFSLNGNEHCWVVDPNDGTADFLRGLKGSAISVGLLKNSVPVLGVVYAPVTDEAGPDLFAWSTGMPCILRNGRAISSTLHLKDLTCGEKVMVSAAAISNPVVNAELCFPAEFIAMPSIAYRLARAAAGDGVAGVSAVPVSAHDVVAGHALLIGAGGTLLDQYGNAVQYQTDPSMTTVSQRCFGGSLAACKKLALKDWSQVFKS